MALPVYDRRLANILHHTYLADTSSHLVSVSSSSSYHTSFLRFPWYMALGWHFVSVSATWPLFPVHHETFALHILALIWWAWRNGFLQGGREVIWLILAIFAFIHIGLMAGCILEQSLPAHSISPCTLLFIYSFFCCVFFLFAAAG